MWWNLVQIFLYFLSNQQKWDTKMGYKLGLHCCSSGDQLNYKNTKHIILESFFERIKESFLLETVKDALKSNPSFFFSQPILKMTNKNFDSRINGKRFVIENIYLLIVFQVLVHFFCAGTMMHAEQKWLNSWFGVFFLLIQK